MVNALVWGLSWWPLRQLDALGLHPLWTTACVFSSVALLLCVLFPSAWPAFKHTPQLGWLVLASGLTNIGFNWAITTGDVVRVVLLFYLMPSWSLLLAWWLLGERPTRGALLRLLLSLVGMWLVLQTPQGGLPLPQDLADYLALAAGCSFAFTNIWLLRLQHTPESARMMAMFGGGAVMAIACALVAHASGLVPAFNTDVSAWWPWVAGLAAAIWVGNFALQYGAARLSAHTTSMVMMSEIVFASVSSIALGAASPTWRVALGGGLIVVTALMASHGHHDEPAHTQD